MSGSHTAASLALATIGGTWWNWNMVLWLCLWCRRCDEKIPRFPPPQLDTVKVWKGIANRAPEMVAQRRHLCCFVIGVEFGSVVGYRCCILVMVTRNAHGIRPAKLITLVSATTTTSCWFFVSELFKNECNVNNERRKKNDHKKAAECGSPGSPPFPGL